MKTSQVKLKIDIYLFSIGFLFLLILSFIVSWILANYCIYWEGLGYLQRGSFLLFQVRSYIAGIPLCIIFIIRMILRFQKDQVLISILRLILGLSFLIYPVIMNTAGFFLIFHLSQEDGCVQFSRGFRDRIESYCSVEEVRAWAQAFLDSRENSGDEYGSSLKEVPPFINRIDLQNEIAQQIYVSVVDGIINLSCGGSALSGHFGIIIGPSDYVREEGYIKDGPWIYYLKWKPGIYVYYE